MSAPTPAKAPASLASPSFAANFSKITGTGSYLPPRRVSNEDLALELAAKGIETSSQWIIERTGIHARHFAAPDVTASDLALPACLNALQAAGRSVGDVDLIIVATSTPDMVFPSTAAILQHKLALSVQNTAAATVEDRKSTRLNSSHRNTSRMPSSA